MPSSNINNTQKIPLVKFVTVRLFLLQAEKMQLDVAPYLVSMGFPEVLTEKNAALYLPEICLLRLVRKLSQTISKRQFALYLQGCATLLVKELLDKSYINCQTVQQALQLFTKQISSYSNHQHLKLTKQGDNFHLQAQSERAFDKGTYWSENLTLLLMIQFIRQVTTSDWLPKAIMLRNDNLHLLSKHLDLSSIQVYFAQAQLSIEIEHGLLNKALSKQTLVNKNSEFQSLPVLSFSENIKHALTPYIGCDNCSVDQFCSIIDIHKRQLQRLLKAEGTSYKQIKEQLSINFAIQLIQEKRFSMADIAEHLGYLSTSQFARAVKRITGKTPSQHY